MFKIFFALILSASFAIASEISGVIEQGSLPKDTFTSTGSIFVYARKEGVTAGPPVAVLRIPSPKFPQKFTLTAQNVMIGGPEAFTGNLSVSAKYSPSGDALDKTGPTGIDEKNKVVMPGAKNLKIVLKK